MITLYFHSDNPYLDANEEQQSLSAYQWEITQANNYVKVATLDDIKEARKILGYWIAAKEARKEES